MLTRLAAAALLAATPALAQDVVMAITDVEGLEQPMQEYGAVETALEESTSLWVELFPSHSAPPRPRRCAPGRSTPG
jgi:phosphonate transport system substrate-binding protein